ncbi:MAG: hypothetical protein WD971_02450, partial [Pirellulales bacterium]
IDNIGLQRLQNARDFRGLRGTGVAEDRVEFDVVRDDTEIGQSVAVEKGAGLSAGDGRTRN